VRQALPADEDHRAAIHVEDLDVAVAAGRLATWPTHSALPRELAATATHVVGIGLGGLPVKVLRDKLRIYYAEDRVPFYRVTVLYRAECAIPIRTV